MAKHVFDEQLGNAVRCFSQIESSEAPITGTALSEESIRLLVSVSNHRMKITYLLRFIVYKLSNTLLHILHPGWFDSDDTRRFQRLRNKSHLDWWLHSGFEEMDAGSFIEEGFAGNSILHYWSVLFQSSWPNDKVVLLVRSHSVSDQSRPVSRIDLMHYDLSVYATEQLAIQDVCDLPVLPLIKGALVEVTEINHILLTLDKPGDRPTFTPSGSVQKYFTERERKLADGINSLWVRFNQQ
jgi:hypothetical protein